MQVVWKHSSAQIAVRDKENRGFYLNLVYELYNNIIGKKIHILVKENTPYCHKIRQECGFTQRPHFSLYTYYCVFSVYVLCV